MNPCCARCGLRIAPQFTDVKMKKADENEEKKKPTKSRFEKAVKGTVRALKNPVKFVMEKAVLAAVQKQLKLPDKDERFVCLFLSCERDHFDQHLGNAGGKNTGR